MENVLLKEIYPDPHNPRKDFGDIDALAATFELNTANPGEPVNPIVVVRDGARFRIVDGERRYRAMAKRKRIACCVIACDDYAEADSVVQMLATNSKMELSEQERSRGFQLMMTLGVDDTQAERAAGVAKGTAERVRRARSAVADPDMCEQLTIDRLEAIAEFADDDDAVEKLCAANGSSWIGVRDKLRRAAKNRELADGLRAAAEEAGIEVHGELPDGCRGYVRCGYFSSLHRLSAAIEAGDVQEGAVAVLDMGSEWSGPAIAFWCNAADIAESDAARAEREIDEEAERAAEAFLECVHAHFSYIAGLIGSVGFEGARTQFPATWALVLELAIDGKGYDRSGIRDMTKRIMAFNKAAGSDLDIEWTASLFCQALFALYPDIDSYETKYAVAAEHGDIADLVHYIPPTIGQALAFADAFAADGLQVPQEEQRMYDAWRKFLADAEGE